MVSFLKVNDQNEVTIHKITQFGYDMEVKDRTGTKKNMGAEHFFLDMRFWLILVMLAAFVGFLIFLNPG
jgi:hypothetical protein